MAERNGGEFAGKAAFVTGSGSGTGRAAALAFAQEGAAVAAADLSEAANAETVRMIEALGARALALRCDVTSSEEVKHALEEAAAKLGPHSASVPALVCHGPGIPPRR